MSFLAVWSALAFVTAAPPTTKPARPTVESVCPGLASGALTSAALADLPDSVLVRSAEMSVTAADVAKELEGVPDFVRAPLERQTFYVAEQLAERRLLLAAARAARKKDQPVIPDGQLINDLLRPIAAQVKVDEAEVKAFYERNVGIFGGAPLKGVRPYVEAFLREEKEEAAVREFIRTLGNRMTIEVSAAWARAQLKAARDNPLDQARWSGKGATLVGFGTEGCACRPDETEPLLGAVAEQLKDRVAVLFIDGQKEFILARRYGVETFPTFVVFDQAGREVARRIGAMSPEDLIALVPKVK